MNKGSKILNITEDSGFLKEKHPNSEKKKIDLPVDVRERLIRLAGMRITADGTLVIDARRFRLQEQNRQAAIDRLVELIRKAAERPKVRCKTRPKKAPSEGQTALQQEQTPEKVC